jgi:hypothetical protein
MKCSFLPSFAAALFLLGPAQPAFAQGPTRTIEIAIPVKLTNFGGRQAWVWCELRDGSNHGVAANYREIPVSNGTADLKVTIAINILSTQEANIAGWRCVVTAPDPTVRGTATGGGMVAPKYSAIPNLPVFGEITGKF